MFDFVLHVTVMACIYSLLALSLNMQAGYGGLMNFGQIALFGAGTYGVAMAFSYNLGIPAGVAIGLLMGAAIALLFARLGRSLEADYWGIATLAVAEVLRIFALNEAWLTGGAQGIGGIPGLFTAFSGRERLYVILLFMATLLVLAVLLCRRLTNGRYGLALKLMREQPQLAASLGYDTDQLKRQCMVVGGLIAASAGILFAHYLTFVAPEQLIGAETFLIWAMIIIGGVGNHMGAIAGAFLLQFLVAFVPFVKDMLGLPNIYVAAIRLMIVGGGLVAFLLWRNRGLIPEKTGGFKIG